MRVEVVGRDRLGLEEQVTADPGVPGVERPRHERRDVVGCARQPQVRVDQLALVAAALGIVEVRERASVGGAGRREGPRAVAVRDAVLPLQPDATAAERRDEPGQLGMDRPAVVALVVVLGEHLVVGGHVVGEGEPGREARERVARETLAELDHRVVEVVRAVRRQVDEDEAAPGANRHLVQPERRRVEVLDALGVRCLEQLTVQVVGPGVVGAAQGPDGTGRGSGPGIGRHHLRAPVTADVVRRVELSVPSAGDQDRLADHVEHGQPSGPVEAQVVAASDAEPAVEEHHVTFAGEVVGVDVHLLGQCRLEAGSSSGEGRRHSGLRGCFPHGGDPPPTGFYPDSRVSKDGPSLPYRMP